MRRRKPRRIMWAAVGAIAGAALGAGGLAWAVAPSDPDLPTPLSVGPGEHARVAVVNPTSGDCAATIKLLNAGGGTLRTLKVTIAAGHTAFLDGAAPSSRAIERGFVAVPPGPCRFVTNTELLGSSDVTLGTTKPNAINFQPAGATFPTVGLAKGFRYGAYLTNTGSQSCNLTAQFVDENGTALASFSPSIAPGKTAGFAHTNQASDQAEVTFDIQLPPDPCAQDLVGGSDIIAPTGATAFIPPVQ